MNLSSHLELPVKAEFVLRDSHDTLKLTHKSHTLILPIVMPREIEQQNGGQAIQRVSMDHLCEVFLNTIGTRRPSEFEAKELIDRTGIQQRRVYDLMNILEGCGFIKRISKGKYNWFGFEQPPKKKGKDGTKKKATSLYSLAAKVKYLLNLLKEEITFKNICHKIIQQHHDKKQNPDSIRRRVYECCKVLHILGLINKENGKFKWIQTSQRETNIPVIKEVRTQTKHKQPLTTDKSQEKTKSKTKQQEKRMFDQLLKQIHNEREFNEMIGRLRLAFDKKLNNAQTERKLFKD